MYKTKDSLRRLLLSVPNLTTTGACDRFVLLWFSFWLFVFLGAEGRFLGLVFGGFFQVSQVERIVTSSQMPM